MAKKTPAQRLEELRKLRQMYLNYRKQGLSDAVLDRWLGEQGLTEQEYGAVLAGEQEGGFKPGYVPGPKREITLPEPAPSYVEPVVTPAVPPSALYEPPAYFQKTAATTPQLQRLQNALSIRMGEMKPEQDGEAAKIAKVTGYNDLQRQIRIVQKRKKTTV